MRFSPLRLIQAYGETLWVVRYSLLTIAAMLAIGTLTRYSGLDATLGLAFARHGIPLPVLRHAARLARRGADGLRHGLERPVRQLAADHGGAVAEAGPHGLSPILMAAANSSGGVMGKMIDAQSIVVASTATNWFGHEGTILRFVFWHSIALACLVGSS